ncbi:MAG: hypothetical protein Q4C09_05615 [Atopobiaceae bacterium]|nr:hypothetical protein [Atopobiaceae bacterium]
MLDGYGLHSIVWNRVDERFEEVLVASSADAVGRGMRLVGGNGTVYSSSAYGYARMVIDRAGQAGYLTA